MKSGNTRARFGYADDNGVLGIGRTIAESANKAQQEVDNLLEWANNHAISFDTQKSEVKQFPGRRQEEAVGVLINGTMIEPAEHIR